VENGIEDVMDLLDAQIDVLSTMNVQHIESLMPMVLNITGVQVR
jgi:two-component system sensor histidine kinase KdpD